MFQTALDATAQGKLDIRGKMGAQLSTNIVERAQRSFGMPLPAVPMTLYQDRMPRITSNTNSHIQCRSTRDAGWDMPPLFIPGSMANIWREAVPDQCRDAAM